MISVLEYVSTLIKDVSTLISVAILTLRGHTKMPKMKAVQVSTVSNTNPHSYIHITKRLIYSGCQGRQDKVGNEIFYIWGVSMPFGPPLRVSKIFKGTENTSPQLLINWLHRQCTSQFRAFYMFYDTGHGQREQKICLFSSDSPYQLITADWLLPVWRHSIQARHSNFPAKILAPRCQSRQGVLYDVTDSCQSLIDLAFILAVILQLFTRQDWILIHFKLR